MTHHVKLLQAASGPTTTGGTGALGESHRSTTSAVSGIGPLHNSATNAIYYTKLTSGHIVPANTVSATSVNHALSMSSSVPLHSTSTTNQLAANGAMGLSIGTGLSRAGLPSMGLTAAQTNPPIVMPPAPWEDTALPVPGVAGASQHLHQRLSTQLLSAAASGNVGVRSSYPSTIAPGGHGHGTASGVPAWTHGHTGSLSASTPSHGVGSTPHGMGSQQRLYK